MKTYNVYAARLRNSFDRTPKHIYASIAFSFAQMIYGEDLDNSEIENEIIEEWETLYKNQITNCKPKVKKN